MLIVLAHPDATSLCAVMSDDVRTALTQKGHQVRMLDLYADDFDPVMSAADRVAYETDDPIVDPMVRSHADLVNRADALVFVYPTVTGGLPAMLKGWLERVLVTGVAFELDAKTNKIKPAMRQVRRIGVVTTTPSTRLSTAVRNDAGRRSLHRTLRLICHPLTRRTFLAQYRADRKSLPEQNIFRDRVQKAFAQWV